jgi:hypothetical protein
MAVQTLTLAAGTNVTKHFNLPKCGSWVGAELISLSTFGSNATVHSWLFYYPDAGDGKIRVRRTGGTTGNNFQEWTLTANHRVERGMYAGESLCTINYTASNDISMSMTTNRSAIPTLYPPIPASSGSANEIPISTYPIAGKVYWLPA